MEPLRLVSTLFKALDERDISYIHWKSNEHLPAALRGETDLDLLVDPDDRSEFLGVLDRLGFVALEPPAVRKVPGIDGYLGLDPATGSLIHLDVHYRLVLGEQLVKNHHLPVESWLLDDAARMEGVAVPRPERELLMLYIRSMLKTTYRQFARSILTGGSPLPDRIRREASWLAGLVDVTLLPATAESSGLGITGVELIEFHRRATEDRIDWRYVFDNKRSLRARLRQHERLPRYLAGPKKAFLRLRSGRVLRRLGLGIPPRHLAASAPVVAVVGADGSGKTRLTKDLETWLGRKLVVHHLYYGQPKSGAWFKLLNKPGSVVRNRAGSSGLLTKLARYTDGLKWLSLARARRAQFHKGRRWASQGETVIAERYPLPEFFDMETPMDGPRLQRTGPFANTELKIYREIDIPDLTIVLNTDVATLRDRKLDLTLEEHVAKVEAVESLPAAEGRTFIDAASPYEDVLLGAKNAIWDAIRAGG